MAEMYSEQREYRFPAVNLNIYGYNDLYIIYVIIL